MASGYSDLSEIRKDANSVYGMHQKPPKINLLNEKPRRESLIEQQLTSTIVRPNFGQQQQPMAAQYGAFGPSQQQQLLQQPMQQQSSFGSQDFNRSQQWPNYTSSNSSAHYATASTTQNDFNSSQQRHQQLQPQPGPSSAMGHPNVSFAGPPGTRTVTIKTTATTTSEPSRAYSNLVHELAEKEAKLKREMAYMNQQLSPWARPRQIREPRREPEPLSARSDQRWVRECPSSPSSRPNSRASSTRSTTEADLMEKAAKLLQDVEEMEKKPLKTQQILIESGARSTQSVSPPVREVSSIHTAIIKVPREEVDNKSPLPFAFDNFSTLGIRGNIASVGAAPPERPYAPIFPIVKRTPSPAEGRRY